MDRVPCSRYLQSLLSLSDTSRDQVCRYLQALQARNYASGTLDVIIIVIKRLLRYLSTARRAELAQNLAQVTPADLDSFIRSAQTIGLAPATISLSLTILKGFFEFLRDAGELQIQPVLKHRHTIFTPASLPKPMAEDDLVDFFKVIDSARDRLLFLLMLRCGLRVSEACALTWKDVDLSGGTLLILNGKGQVDRVAYLAPDTEQALQIWKQAQKPTSVYLFPGQKPRRTPLTTRTVNWMMREYLCQAGIEKPYTPHCLRHTFATELLNAGVRLEVLKELMGHRSLHMTLRYTELYEATKRQQYDQAMEQIEQRQTALRR